VNSELPKRESNQRPSSGKQRQNSNANATTTQRENLPHYSTNYPVTARRTNTTRCRRPAGQTQSAVADDVEETCTRMSTGREHLCVQHSLYVVVVAAASNGHADDVPARARCKAKGGRRAGRPTETREEKKTHKKIKKEREKHKTDNKFHACLTLQLAMPSPRRCCSCSCCSLQEAKADVW
jgi:hypothetical protein